MFENFVFHGASEQILIDAHPHIGTNKLPKIVENIRETILKHGGEIHFESRVVDFVINAKKEIIAVLDIDSDSLDHFSEVDKVLLERLLKSFANRN